MAESISSEECLLTVDPFQIWLGNELLSLLIMVLDPAIFQDN